MNKEVLASVSVVKPGMLTNKDFRKILMYHIDKVLNCDELEGQWLQFDINVGPWGVDFISHQQEVDEASS